ncbi:MAG: radical SAM protein, partial [Kiritimatiellae bacterium]|nr:radical SAM protein [Kiritimatiellia bacterium]
MPLAQIKKVIDEFRTQGGIGLTLSGGECMLHPDFDEIVRYARSKDLIVGILSNLTLCTDEKIKVLVEAEATVQVSLYSMNPETHDAITKRPGSFAATKTAIEKLRKAQIPCRISCPTMKPNYKDYLDVLAYARSLKMDAQTDFIIMGKMDCDTSNLKCRLDLAETRHILEDIIFKSVPINSEYFDPAKKDDMLTDE